MIDKYCHNNGLSGEKAWWLPEILINRILIKWNWLYSLLKVLIIKLYMYVIAMCIAIDIGQLRWKEDKEATLWDWC